MARYPKKLSFSARGDKCPICKKEFRSSACPHSVPQALERIERDYIKQVALAAVGEGT